MKPTIGVLAVQGAFAEHVAALEQLGASAVELRQLRDLEAQPLDGLILPGGESTAMGKLLRDLGLLAPLRQLITGGLPVFGTCAGMILLAKHLENDPSVHLGTMEVSVERNAYGRQLGSFSTEAEFAGIGLIPMRFIRAPFIRQAADSVKVLSRVEGKVVAARQGNQLAVSFHPELTQDLRVHAYFLRAVSSQSANQK